jgi:hypothetical protein
MAAVNSNNVLTTGESKYNISDAMQLDIEPSIVAYTGKLSYSYDMALLPNGYIICLGNNISSGNNVLIIRTDKKSISSSMERCLSEEDITIHCLDFPKEPSHANAITMMPYGYICIAWARFACVVMYDRQFNSVHVFDSYNVSGSAPIKFKCPNDVAIMILGSRTVVAICDTLDKYVCLFDSQTKLLLRTLHFKRQPRAIAVINNNLLLVVCIDNEDNKDSVLPFKIPNKDLVLFVMTIEGEIVAKTIVCGKKLCTDLSGVKVSVLNNINIFVSNEGNRSIMSFLWNPSNSTISLTHIFGNTGSNCLVTPRGIISYNNGDVLVMDPVKYRLYLFSQPLSTPPK